MPHPVVHFEIGCRDRAKTAQFFTQLFGWQIQDGPAATIDTGSKQGIPGHITSLGHEPQHYTIFYVEVENAQAYLDKAVALGGKVVGSTGQNPDRNICLALRSRRQYHRTLAARVVASGYNTPEE